MVNISKHVLLNPQYQLSFPVLITTHLQLYGKENCYWEYLYSVQQSDFFHKRSLKFHADSMYEGTCYNSLSDSLHEKNMHTSHNSKPPLKTFQQKETN